MQIENDGKKDRVCRRNGDAADCGRCFIHPPNPVVHRSPGHHVDGGSLAEIFVVRSATRWLRLYG